MSIKTEIDRIKQSKADIISALKSKGVTVPTDASIDDLSALVEAIEIATDPVLQSKTVSPSTSSQTVKPDTGYDGLSQVTVNAMTTATQATPSISVSSSGLITASATQTAGYVSAGTKSATKQLTTKGATTWTPKTSNQTISSGTYLTGTQTIKGDSNLVATNIKSGVSIFGVTGTMSGSEDLSSELTTQNNLITTQETTIDNIISALQGKASGGSGGGLQKETITLNLSITNDGGAAMTYKYIYYIVNNDGFEECGIAEKKVSIGQTYSGSVNLIKGGFIEINMPSGEEIYVNNVTNGIEVIGEGSNILAYVPNSGTLSVYCEGGYGGGLGGM